MMTLQEFQKQYNLKDYLKNYQGYVIYMMTYFETSWSLLYTKFYTMTINMDATRTEEAYVENVQEMFTSFFFDWIPQLNYHYIKTEQLRVGNYGSVNKNATKMSPITTNAKSGEDIDNLPIIQANVNDNVDYDSLYQNTFSNKIVEKFYEAALDLFISYTANISTDSSFIPVPPVEDATFKTGQKVNTIDLGLDNYNATNILNAQQVNTKYANKSTINTFNEKQTFLKDVDITGILNVVGNITQLGNYVVSGNAVITGNLDLNTVDSTTGTFTIHTNSAKTNSIRINDNSSKPRIQYVVNNNVIANLELNSTNDRLVSTLRLQAPSATDANDLVVFSQLNNFVKKDADNVFTGSINKFENNVQILSNLNFVKADGTLLAKLGVNDTNKVAFTSPIIGVAGTEANHLATVAQISGDGIQYIKIANYYTTTPPVILLDYTTLGITFDDFIRDILLWECDFRGQGTDKTVQITHGIKNNLLTTTNSIEYQSCRYGTTNGIYAPFTVLQIDATRVLATWFGAAANRYPTSAIYCKIPYKPKSTLKYNHTYRIIYFCFGAIDKDNNPYEYAKFDGFKTTKEGIVCYEFPNGLSYEDYNDILVNYYEKPEQDGFNILLDMKTEI